MAEIQNITESWERHEGAEVEEFIKRELSDKINNVSVNGEPQPKQEGSVEISVPSVDDVLSPESGNAISNAAVSSALEGIRSSAFHGVHTEAGEDADTIKLVFTNSSTDEVDSVSIPKASGGSTTYPKITTRLLTGARMKVGGTIQVEWTYNYYPQEEALPADSVTIRAVLDDTEIYSQTLYNVQDGQGGTIVLGPDIVTHPGKVGIYVNSATTKGEEVQPSQGYKYVQVIAMSLSSTFDPAERLSAGGWTDDTLQIVIPYSYTVPSGSTLRVWLDGQEHSTQTIGNTGRNWIYVQAAECAPGRHTVRMIAESDGLLSNAVSVDFLKAGGNDDYIGINTSFDVPTIAALLALDTDEYRMDVPLFGDLVVLAAAWRYGTMTSSVTVQVGDDQTPKQTLAFGRTSLTIRQRMDDAGNVDVTIANGVSSVVFHAAVSSDIDITEREAQGYRVKLTAEGRSNSETNPAEWGGITTFEGVDWSTNGWVRGSDGVNALQLTNGARATIDIRPFVRDVQDGDYTIARNGMALEFEVFVTQVTERGATIMHCLHDNGVSGWPIGLKMTTEEAGLMFGGVEEIHTGEEDVVERAKGVAMNIAIDRWMHIAFVVHPSSQGSIAMMYINGVLSRANLYDPAAGLIQNTPKPITFDSDKADIRIRGLRYYRMPVESDGVLGNYIIDRPTPYEIQVKHAENAVCNDNPDKDGNLSIDKTLLRAKGKGVLTIIRSEDSGDGLTDLFNCTVKDDNFRGDVVKWEPPLDNEGNPIGEGFEARNIRIRIQGTSSVKYPYKNIRLYLTTLYDKNIPGTTIDGGYALRGDGKSKKQNVLCAKTDFVDSSLTLNTGGAHLFNDTLKALNLLTPPQSHDERVRQSIDGIPCDVYAGTSEGGALTYYGQFVLNNEKSKSGKIFGMEGVEGFSPTCPIALETLTNLSPMTLFHPAGNADSQALDEQLEEYFDDGFEFNFPEDVYWNAEVAEVKKGTVATESQKNAIKRLLGWIYECVPSSMRTEPEYGSKDTEGGWSDASKAKWVSQKFKDEAKYYFDIDHLLTYYVITDYWASVDQRAKNILWRTWDGEIWYATYYDGDTAQSIRNDAFMVYLYDVTRDTFDIERQKFAFEGHDSWLWCLVLANFETQLKVCAERLRVQLTTQKMLDEFNGVMMGNWSERQYNKSGRLKYIDTIPKMNFVYTLTGNREMHRTQFLTDRARLLDARYGSGDYNNDVMDFVVVRSASDPQTYIDLVSNDLYYFGYRTTNVWYADPAMCKAGDTLRLNFFAAHNGNDPLRLTGASCIKKLDLSNMGTQLNGPISMAKCIALEELYMPADNGVSNVAPLTLGDTSKLTKVDITGQTIHTGTAGVFDVSKHTRLHMLKAGGTSLTNVIIPEGCPIVEYVLPSTLVTLTLRHLPMLTHDGLTLGDDGNGGTDTSAITALNFSDCPHLDWRTLLSDCPNVRKLRIEGMKGLVRSSEIRVFMEGYDPTSPNPTANMSYHGLAEDGTEQTYPAMTGKLTLIDVVDDFPAMREFFDRCGLELVESQYTDYWFDDLETDPANITNEDNKTGYAYLDPETEDMNNQPNIYLRSGHVKLLHDLCWPVAGKIDVRTNKMTITRLSKSSFLQTESGAAFNPSDPNGEGYDIFLYIPRYWYKGVNDYKNSRKHFFLSALDNEPASTAANIQRYTLSETLFANGKAVDNRIFRQGVEFDENLLSPAATCNTHRVNVAGMKQVRFPSINHSNFSCAFVGADGTILAIHALDLTNVGTDFMDAQGDYDFRAVPDNAELLYFTCLASVDQSLEVIAVDSDQTEAIEPDWVEHLPELVGIYGGSVPGITEGGTVSTGAYGLRSISGKATSRGNRILTTNTQWTYDDEGNPTNIPATQINGTAQDFFNLARKRGDGYTTVTYETSKNIANLFMAWFGTRDVESKVGAGGTASYTTGARNNYAYADTDVNTLQPPYPSNTNQLNKIWGIEGWTGSVAEFTDNIVLNAASFSAFIRNFRNPNYTWAVDYFFNVVMQNGSERRVKTIVSNSVLNVEKVRFGRFCDIIASRYSQNTSYTTCYAASSVAYGGQGRIVTRGGANASSSSGMANNEAGERSIYSHPSYGARLCYCGDIIISND